MARITVFLCLAAILALAAGQGFQIPDLYLQAGASGAFRAYLPDDCDYEKLDFEWRKGEGGWERGEVLSPVGGYWTYEAPGAFLAPGDPLTYSVHLLHHGTMYHRPQQHWTVPDLVEEFTPPPPGKCQNSTSPKPDKMESTTPKKEQSSTTPSQSTTPKQEPSTTEGSQDRMPEPTTPAVEGLGGICLNPWLLDPVPGDPRDVILEKQLARMRCELTKHSAVSTAVYKELTDLKKLNYAMVARMQRLESILRSSPFLGPQTFPLYR